MTLKSSLGARTLAVVVLAAAGAGGIAAASEGSGQSDLVSGGPSRSADVPRDTLAGAADDASKDR